MNGQTCNVAQQFARDDADRQTSLDTARDCAALSKPSVLPPQGREKNSRLPQKYTDIGTRAVTNMTGKMLLAMFPPSQPWFRFQPDIQIDLDPNVPDEQKQEIRNRLNIREIVYQSILESANVRPMDNSTRRRRGFRSHKRAVLDQLLITGDTLEHMADDYRMRLFRRTSYVTRRDDSGDVMYHITTEKVDPLTLSDEQLAMLTLRRADVIDQQIAARELDMYTKVCWQPQTKVWLIEQKIRGVHITDEHQEEVSPYFSTAFDLAGGDNYGTSWIEANFGDLKTLNELRLRALDFAAIASKITPVIDRAAGIKATDLAKPSGVAIVGRVINGVVQDIGMLQANKMADFSVVRLAIQDTNLELSKAFMLEMDAQPHKDRVTAAQINRIAAEVDTGTGGLYATISDDQQIPTLQRLDHQIRRDKLMPPLPKGLVNLRTLTGIAALGREQERQNVLTLVQVLAQLGPDAMARVDMSVLTDVLARTSGVYEPGLIKSKDQMMAEQQAAQQQQIQAQVAQQAVQSTGKITELAAAASAIPSQ